MTHAPPLCRREKSTFQNRWELYVCRKWFIKGRRAYGLTSSAKVFSILKNKQISPVPCDERPVQRNKHAWQTMRIWNLHSFKCSVQYNTLQYWPDQSSLHGTPHVRSIMKSRLTICLWKKGIDNHAVILTSPPSCTASAKLSRWEELCV